MKHHGPMVLAAALVIGACSSEASDKESGTASSLPSGLRGSSARMAKSPLAEIEIAADATKPTRIRDAASGMSVAFTLEGARPSEAVHQTEAVVYPAGGPAGERIEHRLSRQGAEDYVSFDHRPEREELRYRIDVSEAAGLRLVAGHLELLDAAGVPRLRMAAPWLEDAEGRRVDASVTLEDCAADTSPAPPWGRPVTPPGMGSCSVRVAWGESGGRAVRYPAVLDPAWTTTTNTMNTPRIGHSATLLNDGRVLITGGEYLSGASSNEYVASTELFDPETNTFTVTGPLATGRSYHIAQRLDDGRVLVAAGRGSDGALKSAEIYDPTDGSWEPAPSLAVARRRAAAAPLPDGRVLVAGGIGVSNQVLSSVEIFDPEGAGSWTSTGDMSYRRHGHTLEVLPNGKVMAIAGITTTSTSDLSACEIFEPLTSSWMPTGNLGSARYYHASAVLGNGAVLVAGGYSRGISANTPTSERFNPDTGTWTSAGSVAARNYFTLTTLKNGAAVAVGGVTMREFVDITTRHTTVELYDPARARWSRLDPLSEARHSHAATALVDGRLLVTGGAGPLGALASAELLAFDPIGASCTVAVTCGSGHCVHGVCCESACDQPCWSCSAEATGQPDGTCAPVLAGTDPYDACKDDGSPSCEQNGLCDGAGVCQHYPGQPCAPRACATHGECTSGRCFDGICCDASCSSACRACTAEKKGYGEDGVCEPVADGTDPDGECIERGSGVCAADGLCEGGRCVLSTAGMECASAGCIDETTAGRAAVCSASGTCPTQSTTRCSPYRCDDTTGTCRDECGSDADCVSGLTCTAGRCQARPRGAACEAADQCASRDCSDGLCCDRPCTGQCEACDLPGHEGTCMPVTGAPRGDRPACERDPDSPCGAGACDGSNRSSCSFAGTEVICGGSTCSDGVETGLRCDGAGQCRSVETSRACAPYACGADACNESCASDEDCATGPYTCNAQGECVTTTRAYCAAEDTVKRPDGTSTQCSPFRCTDGTCVTSCSTDDDCVAGAFCNPATSECLGGSGGGGGCGCHTPGGSSPGAPLAALLGAVLLVLRRRRCRP